MCAILSGDQFEFNRLTINMKIYIEGVAALGKTSFIKALNESPVGIPAVPGDYYEFCEATRRENTSETRALFQTTYLNRPNGVYDRSPFSTLFFNMVFKEMAGETYEELMSNTCKQLNAFLGSNEVIIMLIPTEELRAQEIVDRMTSRQNGIDVLTKEYVFAQIKVFSAVCDNCPKIFRFNVGPLFDWPPQLRNLIVSLWYSTVLVHGPSKKQLVYDAGIDLSCAEETELLPETVNMVPLQQRVFIPPGFVGIIYARSSFRRGIVENGVVDATYGGPLFAKVIVPAPTLIGEGEYFAQIVVQPIARRITRVLDIPFTGRGSCALGSTNTS